MKILAHGESSTGPEREKNEDSFLVDPALNLYLVCDGMGGHAAGERASSIAVSTIQDCIRERLAQLDGLAPDDLGAAGSTLMREAIQAASRRIYEEAQRNPELNGMGTTATVVLIVGSRAILGHVGDSRCYLRRKEKMHQLSRDHTLGAEMLAKGKSTAGSLKRMPFMHVLTRAVGTQESVEVDTLVFDVLPTDTLLLCSDGLESVYDDPYEAFDLTGGEVVDAIPGRLIAMANQRDGSDNSTAVVVRAISEDSRKDEEQALEREVTLQVNALQRLYIFQDLELNEILQIMERVTIHRAQAESDIVREGEPGDAMLVILEGRVAVFHQASELSTLEQGNHFGEMSLLTTAPRSATVRTTVPSVLLRLERASFENLLQSEPVLGVKLLRALSRELADRLEATSQKLGLRA